MFSERKKLPTKPPHFSGDEDDKHNSVGTPRTKSLSSSSANSEKHDDPKPVVQRLHFKQKEEPSLITRNGREVGGIIAPTSQQRQMMRQVSGLGLEDPVFGGRDINNPSIKNEHASFFFEDMDIDDVPEDMIDMISVVSDRTDQVPMNDIQSIDASEKIPTGYSYASSNRRGSGSNRRESGSNRRGSVCTIAPLGLDPEAAAASLQKAGKIPRNSTLNDSTHQSVVSGLSHAPPTRIPKPKPLFKTGRRSSSASRALDDTKLAAEVNAMLSLNDRSSIHSTQSHGRSTQGARQANRASITRQDSRLSSCSSKYAPPPLPMPTSTPIVEGERSLPESMEDIFPM
eukprot:CAMPEP_0172367620 /NCGR_PEP_ID=MMETSP1060-20121228/22689_1 /TAXON_ID=37318 /ORGANISM="Pseudo-nitzschia pungens, Strain cf. cingulata" /LENGTH=342 /DNA_ID=CAMNT_0013091939 /DNA_START=133 /DNA_END=1161 /DNA_ORIENTATION=-